MTDFDKMPYIDGRDPRNINFYGHGAYDDEVIYSRKGFALKTLSEILRRGGMERYANKLEKIGEKYLLLANFDYIDGDLKRKEKYLNQVKDFDAKLGRRVFFKWPSNPEQILIDLVESTFANQDSPSVRIDTSDGEFYIPYSQAFSDEQCKIIADNYKKMRHNKYRSFETIGYDDVFAERTDTIAQDDEWDMAPSPIDEWGNPKEQNNDWDMAPSPVDEWAIDEPSSGKSR